MPDPGLGATLTAPAVQTTVHVLGAVLVVLVLRELPKIPRQLRVLMAAAFVDMFGVFLVVPLLPFWCKEYGTGTTWFGHPLDVGTVTGLVMATFTVAQLLSAPFWGRFSDRAGRRPALLVALLGSALGYLLFAVADSLWLLLLSRLVQGAGGGTVGVIQAYVADSVGPEQRARALGWLSAATNLGVALGPVFGSWTLQFGDVDLWPGAGHWQLGGAAPGLGAALLCFANIGFAARWLPESKASHPPGQRPGTGRALAALFAAPLAPVSRLLLLYAIAIGAGQGINAVLPHLLDRNLGIGKAEIGVVYTFLGEVSVLARVLVLGVLVDRLGEVRLSRLGTVSLSGGLLLLPFANGLGTLALAVGLLPLGMALLFPCVSALLSRLVPAAERGLWLGLQQTGGGLARMVFPLTFGALFDGAGAAVPFLVAGAAVLLTLPLGLRLGAVRAAVGPHAGS